MKKIILIFLLLFFVQGCSAISSLNAEEKRAYDYITASIEQFHNPSSVRLSSAYVAYVSDLDLWIYAFNIRAENTFGATQTKCYSGSTLKSRIRLELSESPNCGKTSSGIDIKRINSALEEYIKDKGWD